MNQSAPASPTARSPFKTPLGLVVVLGGLGAFAPLSIDMYLPALPQMVRDLHAHAADGALSVSAFFVGVCLGQLFYGPISDRIGRRPPLLAGLALYVAASIGCAVAPSVEALIALRFLQALGGCAGMVIARAIIRDRFAPDQTAHMFSMLLAVVSIAPIIAPLIGSSILLIGDWRVIFWLLTAFGSLVGVASLLWIRETRSAATETQARSETVLRSYRILLTEPRLMGYCLATGCAHAGLLTYIAIAPDIIITSFKISPQVFGMIFASNGAGLVAANYLNRRLLRQWSYDRILRWANLGSMTAAAVLLADGITGFGGLWGVTIPLFFIVGSMGFTQANAFAGAMAVDPQRAGATSALAGSMQFAIGAVAASLAGLLHDGTAKPMGLVILGACMVSGLALRLLAKPAA